MCPVMLALLSQYSPKIRARLFIISQIRSSTYNVPSNIRSYNSQTMRWPLAIIIPAQFDENKSLNLDTACMNFHRASHQFNMTSASNYIQHKCSIIVFEYMGTEWVGAYWRMTTTSRKFIVLRGLTVECVDANGRDFNEKSPP